MALDGIFLNAVKNEISQKCLDSRVEKIHQPSKDELVISLRARGGAYKLLLSAKPDCPRVHLTDYAPENPQKPPMFCMLLRKHLTGARLISINQNQTERILSFEFDASNELGDRVGFKLIIEIMARFSNIILINEKGFVVDSIKRVDSSKSSVRELFPGVRYVSPPPQNKLCILESNISDIQAAISRSEKRLSKAFMDTVQGVSPVICREYEFGAPLEMIKKYAENPVPILVWGSGFRDFTFMPVKQYGALVENKKFDSFSKLLDSYYFEHEKNTRIKQSASELFRRVNTLHERALRKAQNRIQELRECEGKETLKIYGELITANQYRLEKGALFYELENYYSNGEKVKIPVDPALTPMQNAQRYFKEYRKKQTAQSKLNAFIREAQDEADYLETVIDSLERCETSASLSAIRQELADGGYIRSQKKNGKNNQKPQPPLEFKSSDGFKILVGRNNLQNDRLTVKTANNHDLWLHTKDFPGSHTIIESNMREFSEQSIYEGAMLAAYHSKGNLSGKIAVDYTLIKNVKKPSGAKPGKVIYTDYQTIYVTPDRETVERLRCNE